MRILRKAAAAFVMGYKGVRLGLTSVVLVSLLLTACGSKEGESGAAISLTKEGAVRTRIRESFEQSYYDKDELQQTILAQVADYNRTAGEDRVSVEKVEVEDGMAVVLMTYAKAADYASFNQVVFFQGTAAEAERAGFDLNVVLSSVKDGNETVGKSDILAMEGVNLLITDEREGIGLDGKALYVSDHVTVSQNARELSMAGEEKKLIYIIYK